MSPSTKTLLTLMSKDKHQFTIEKDAAIKSMTLKNMVDEGYLSDVIPLPNVDAKTLALVIEFLITIQADKDLKSLVEEQELSMLINLVSAANFLDIKEMLDAVCHKLADSIKDWTVEEVRKLFGIVNDFTPEEEEAIRNEHRWAFDE